MARTLKALLILLYSASLTATAQFTPDQAKFLEEIDAMFVDARKKEGKDFIELQFTPVWNGSYYSSAMRGRIYDLSNYMLKKRFVVEPDFQAFVEVLITFATKGRPAAEFDKWMQGVEFLQGKGRKKDLQDHLELTSQLFKINALYVSPSTTWKSRSDQYRIEFDSVPKFVFQNTELICLAKGDSAVIKGTRGTYFPITQRWDGVGGVVTWERAGLKPTATFAEWRGEYSIRLKSATFEVDSVIFNDPYFERGMFGKLTDKVLANVDDDNASYPRFESYDRRLRIRDIVDQVDFEGGFAMHGGALQGYGTRDEPAILTFNRDQRPFIITKGLFFNIEQERIASDNVSVTLFLDKDSIVHPSTSLKFIKDKQQLSLIKSDRGIQKSPYFDSFHKLDLYFEALYWKVGDPVVVMGSLQGSSQTRASFESFDYFKRKRYDALLGIDILHPVVRVNDYVKQSGKIFSAQEFAVYARLQKDQVIPMFMDMANKGYLDYDVENETVFVKDRLRQHIMASAGKIDYDVLQFNSNSEDGRNATLNLLNNDLTLSGVARIVVSDSQDVKIFPADRTVVIKKDRDFTFGGLVKAGKLSFYGKDYYFHYDPFVIDLLNVDSVSFYADSFEADEYGNRSLVPVKNVLEDVTGTLEIDEPSNKSGLLEEEYPSFPKFNSTKESYVYYDSKNIQKGVYNRDKFYFKSEPFLLDSLDNFTNARIDFPGTLVSAGIFPDIKEPLRLQKDYSLGFVRGTGDGGMALYEKGSRFTNTITLNYNGLQGEGDIAYLTTTAHSENFVFCPDSTFGVADTLMNTAATTPSKVPKVNAGNVFLRLEPGRDVLLARMIDRPLQMYGGDAVLYGSTELRPSGMTGKGLVDFFNATLASRLFEFETMQLHADTSDFRLTEGDTASIAFITNNVNSTIKLDERVGEFVSNGDETVVEFPVNQYICYMDRFKWYMDEGDIELESDRESASASADLQLAGTNFISTAPDQDSLSFMAPKARYDLKKHLITATNVEYLQVADALIFPDSATVRIRKRAEMDPLENSAIVANYVTKYHNIYNASVRINAKRDYSGSGDYDYVDENKRTQTIRFTNINVDSSYQTLANGRIPETAAFQLSPHFDYFGDVAMRASEKDLTFSGSVRILHDCPGLERNFMAFTASIDPKEIFIPVADTLFNADGSAVGAGVRLTDEDPYQLYGTFLSKLRNEADRPIITASGLLHFNKARQEYQISNRDKIRQRDLPGDLVSINTQTCQIEGDGKILAGVDLGQVKLKNIGQLNHRPDSSITTAKMVMMSDFYFLDNALERMVSVFLAYPEQKPLDITKTNYEKAMKELLGLERSDKLISELSIKGEIKRLPDELIASIVLGDLQLRWDRAEEAFISEGPIGVATVLKKPVYRYVKGKVELQRKRSGDEFTMMLMLDDQTYFFFNYVRNYMYVYSSDEEFNTMLNELKEDRTIYDHKKGEAAYRFMITNKRKVNEFMDRHGL